MQLSVRIAAANALHGAQIGPVHANQQIKPVIICARHLPRRMLPARDSLLKQLAPRRRIHQSPATPSRFTSSFMIYSAIGLRHIFPWQIKSILTPTPPAVFLHHITQSRNRHAISKPRCSTIPVNGMRASFFRAKQYPAERNFTRFPSGGVSQL